MRRKEACRNNDRSLRLNLLHSIDRPQNVRVSQVSKPPQLFWVLVCLSTKEVPCSACCTNNIEPHRSHPQPRDDRSIWAKAFRDSSLPPREHCFLLIVLVVVCHVVVRIAAYVPFFEQLTQPIIFKTSLMTFSFTPTSLHIVCAF